MLLGPNTGRWPPQSWAGAGRGKPARRTPWGADSGWRHARSLPLGTSSGSRRHGRLFLEPRNQTRGMKCPPTPARGTKNPEGAEVPRAEAGQGGRRREKESVTEGRLRAPRAQTQTPSLRKAAENQPDRSPRVATFRGALGWGAPAPEFPQGSRERAQACGLSSPGLLWRPDS